MAQAAAAAVVPAVGLQPGGDAGVVQAQAGAVHAVHAPLGLQGVPGVPERDVFRPEPEGGQHRQRRARRVLDDEAEGRGGGLQAFVGVFGGVMV